MVTKKTSTTLTVGDRSKTVEVTETMGEATDVQKLMRLHASARKDAFRQAAAFLRSSAQTLQEARDNVQNSAPKFVQDSAAFRMARRNDDEKIQLLLGQAGYIETLE